LREQRRLLVHGEPAHGNLGAELRGRADGFRAGDDAGQRRRVHAERVAGLRRPGHRVEVEEQPSRGRRRIGRVRAAQPVQQPRVGRRRHALGRDLLAQPCDLGGREVRIELEAGDGREPLVPAARGEAFTQVGRPPVLPDECRRERAARRALPRKDRLTLVRERDRVDAGSRRRVREGAPSRIHHGVPKLFRVLLHATAGEGGGVHRHLGGAEHLAAVAHDQRLGGGGALVDGEDGRHVRPGSARRRGRTPDHVRRRPGSTRRTPRPRPCGPAPPTRTAGRRRRASARPGSRSRRS
jgi:hypothetical protein